MLTMSSDAWTVGDGFAIWRAALMKEGVRDGSLWRLPEQRIVFRNQAEPRAADLGRRTAFGTDPTGAYWAVQINEADVPGDANVTSGIAVEGGRPFLIRQGRLNSPVRGEGHILEEEFRRLTGLRPRRVRNGDTSGLRREWHVVTPLDVGADGIREATGRFVDRCALARLRRMEEEGDLPDTVPMEGLGRDEDADAYFVPGRAATDAREVRRLQGEVWQRLAAVLRSRDVSIDKPRHAAGYEVDAVVGAPDGPLLVEIKTGSSAADVYGGMGQLQLYPRLLPRLGHHRLVLLLPELPRPALVHAVRACGVLLHTYDMAEGGIDFDEAFLELCGVD